MPRVDSDGDVWEVARRVRAAMAYLDVDRLELARILNISPATLDRISGKRSGLPRGATEREQALIAEACGLPPDWFRCDLDRLNEIPLPGALVSRPETSAREARRRRAKRVPELTREEDPHPDEDPEPPDEPAGSGETDPGAR